MSEEIKNMPDEPVVSNWKMLRAMVGIGMACALLIVFTFEASKPRIKQLKKEALENAITKVVPGISKSVNFKMNNDASFEEFVGEANGETLVYVGYDENNELKGIAIEAAGQGYADIIRILYGYDPEKKAVVGFYVLESKETPGLGDKIEKDENFLANFEALDVAMNASNDGLMNEVITVKNGGKENAWEVEGITGATISSRAIGAIINASAAEMIPVLEKNIDSFKIETGN